MKTNSIDRLAFDFASVRTYDADGHLHVSTANISKATVNPYLAEEVPGWRELGLEKGRIYQMLRDPDELKKAASSFTGKPLLIKHTPIAANDHPHDKVVGAIGEVKYEHPYLKAPLHVWPGDAIDLIKNGKQAQLSCGYKYDPVMRPGTYEGQTFDGRMTDIVGNHCAIVEAGRAGAACIVGDWKEVLMSRASIKSWQALASRVRKIAGDSINNPVDADEVEQAARERDLINALAAQIGKSLPQDQLRKLIQRLESELENPSIPAMDSARKATPILPHDRRLSGSGMGPVWPDYNRILGRR